MSLQFKVTPDFSRARGFLLPFLNVVLRVEKRRNVAQSAVAETQFHPIIVFSLLLSFTLAVFHFLSDTAIRQSERLEEARQYAV